MNLIVSGLGVLEYLSGLKHYSIISWMASVFDSKKALRRMWWIWIWDQTKDCRQDWLSFPYNHSESV